MATIKGSKSKDEVKLNITLASDDEGWNKTVNGQLAIELGRNVRLNVTGFVPKNTLQQRDHARSLNIKLVDAKDHDGFSSSDLLSFPPDSLDIDILLIHCHGLDLGKQAQNIKVAKKCKWVQVVHTISEELHSASEHKLQITLCEKADFIIAIGPKVEDACKRFLRFSEKHENVIDLTPGVFEDLNGVRQMYEDLGTFRILMSGSSKDFEVKGCDIAAKAIQLLNMPSYHLIVIVKPCDNVAEVTQALLNEGIDSRQLTVRVSENRDDWRKWLCEVDLAIKPSRTEGFGMSGLLAISANLPVLISEHSGLGIVLKKVSFGNSHVVDSDDPQVWADRIKQVRAKDPKLRHVEAEKLRDAYSRKFNWKEQCDKLVERLFMIVPQTCGKAITAIERDPVVYAEQSNIVESQQSPPTDSHESSEQPNNEEAIDSSVTSPAANEIQNGGREISTISEQSRNEPRDDQEQTPGTRGKMNNNQHSRKEEQREPERIDGETPNGGRNEEINGQVLYIGDVVDNATLMDELARCLDREYRVLKYWKHLAHELHIPPDAQKGFEIYFELSPTVHLFQFLSTNDPHLTVGKLRAALKDIHRNDLIQELKDISDTGMVVDVFNNEPSLLDGIALKLDSARNPVGNWRNLAGKLISNGQLFKEFEAQLHSSENPTALLFRYLCTTEGFSQLTVGDLKGHLEDKKMLRRDVLAVLDDHGVEDGDFLADVFCPDSDLLNSVCNLLNKKSPGVKNWRYLAYKLGVPNKVYEDFDLDANSPRRRPTKMMLEWLRSEHPDMTVDQLRTAVKGIGRADALEILDGYLSQGIKSEASSGKQFVSLESPPHEEKQKIKTTSCQTGPSDEVDSALRILGGLEISPSKSEPETRLSAAVTNLPLRVYSKLCLNLNIRRLLFDDFRMLGEKVGLTRDQVEYLGQQIDPTDHILKKWSSTGEATVEKLMDILGEEDFGRIDVREILEDWVNGKA